MTFSRINLGVKLVAGTLRAVHGGVCDGDHDVI
jgi:hypothetical protein